MGGESGNDGIVISVGTVEKTDVRDGRSYVEITDGEEYPTRFVFTNNDRKARGNHVKKLRLKKGQTVIAIGARRRFDDIIGWELFRDQGIVRKEDEFAMIGTLKRKVTLGKTGYVVVRMGGRDFHFRGSAACGLNRKVAVRARILESGLPELLSITEIKEAV